MESITVGAKIKLNVAGAYSEKPVGSTATIIYIHRMVRRKADLLHRGTAPQELRACNSIIKNAVGNVGCIFVI